MNKISRNETKSDIQSSIISSPKIPFRFLTKQTIREGRGRRREVPIEGQQSDLSEKEAVQAAPKEADSEAKRAVREYQNKAFQNVLEKASAMVREERKKKEEEVRESQEETDNMIENELLEEGPAEVIRESSETPNEASDHSQSLFEDVEMEE